MWQPPHSRAHGLVATTTADARDGPALTQRQVHNGTVLPPPPAPTLTFMSANVGGLYWPFIHEIRDTISQTASAPVRLIGVGENHLTESVSQSAPPNAGLSQHIGRGTPDGYGGVSVCTTDAGLRMRLISSSPEGGVTVSIEDRQARYAPLTLIQAYFRTDTLKHGPARDNLLSWILQQYDDCTARGHQHIIIATDANTRLGNLGGRFSADRTQRRLRDGRTELATQPQNATTYSEPTDIEYVADSVAPTRFARLFSSELVKRGLSPIHGRTIEAPAGLTSSKVTGTGRTGATEVDYIIARADCAPWLTPIDLLPWDQQWHSPVPHGATHRTVAAAIVLPRRTIRARHGDARAPRTGIPVYRDEAAWAKLADNILHELGSNHAPPSHNQQHYHTNPDCTPRRNRCNC